MTYTVHVVNRKTYTGKGGHYIGRPSPLGNPFTVKQHGHGTAIDLFKDWLNIQWVTNNQPVIRELLRLAMELRDNKEITLICWCAPKPCHGNIIGKALINIVEKGLLK